MKKSIVYLALILFSVAFLQSCDKEPDPIYIYEPKAPVIHDNVKIMADFIRKNETKFQEFSLDASRGGVITTKNGVKYYIPAYAFENYSGMPVSGTIKISIKEIFNISDMILSNKPTLTNKGEMLESVGEFFVKAEQNKQPLRINRDTVQTQNRIGIALFNKNKLTKDIPLWNGDTTYLVTSSGHNHENKSTTVTKNFYTFKGVEWKERYNDFAASTGDTIRFKLPELFGWCNVDVLTPNSSNLTTVLCYFENVFNDEMSASYQGTEPSMCFFKPDNKNTVVKLYNMILGAPADKQGFLSYQKSMPVGMSGTFVVFVVKDGKFYCQKKAVTIAAPAAGLDYTPIAFQLNEVTEADLLNTINSLNQ